MKTAWRQAVFFYAGGKEVARTSVETTGPAVHLELVPDRDGLSGDGRDALPITVRALDFQGRAMPLADPLVTSMQIPAAASPYRPARQACRPPRWRSRCARSRIAGRAQVWLNGQLLRTKASKDAEELGLRLPAVAGPAQLVVIGESRPGEPAAIEGDVLVEPGS
jgi:hypothetical protein